MLAWIAITCAALATFPDPADSLPPAAIANGLRRGGPIAHAPSGCVHPETRAAIEAAIRQYRATNPGPGGTSGGTTGGATGGTTGSTAGATRGGTTGGITGGIDPTDPTEGDAPTPGPFSPSGTLDLFPFFPIAGNDAGDIFHGGFVDLDPASPGYHDYNCMPFTYDGHAGIDTEIRSFAEQAIGVPVFAALDGTVVFAQDGWDDMNTNGGVQGNIVAIDHGGGWETSYYHLKKNSVAVSVNDVVKAGQQVGMVASSGNSFGPHLHFEVRENFVPYEPFAGPCRAGPSGWVNQPPTNLASFFDDFGMWYDDLFAVSGFPNAMPRTGQIGQDDTYVAFWVRGHNLPVDATWTVRFFRPDGTMAHEAAWFFFNTDIWRTYWFNWVFNMGVEIPDMLTIAGTWRVRVEFSDQLMVDAPFDVAPTRTPGFNRPPEPIALSFDPPAPSADEVLFCRVNTALLLDDPDFDIVRYHYVWTIDGTVVRDVTIAGAADAIPRNSGCPGALVECTVTPSDGTADGPTAVATTSILNPGMAAIDLDCDCMLTAADVPLFVEALVSPESFSGCAINRADVNHDGLIDGEDVAPFVAALLP